MTEPVRRRREFAADLAWGARIGLAFGVVYCALATVLLAGQLRSSAPEAQMPPLWLLLSLYLVGGIVGGALIGLFRPLTRSRPGATLVGVLAMLPIAFGF